MTSDYKGLDMPVSFFPLVLTLLLVAIPLLCLAKGKRLFFLGLGGSALFVLAMILPIYIPGWMLSARAHGGDPVAQYELARWHENHCEAIQQLFFWPCEPDVRAGYRWLEQAAAHDYPPALYALGVRLKYGDFVPRPENWTGPGGNVFPQPERGQPLIDRALRLGYKPEVPERLFYFTVFRHEGSSPYVPE
jgi:hypothetical protein